MAGAGAKKFPAFSKLTSNDVNNYLADQVVMRFATTTARDAAFGGVGEPTLAEGMCAYIDADNSIYTYDGSNWVKMVSASQPVGLVLVGSTTFNANAKPFINECFTSDFDNYVVKVSAFGSAPANLAFQLRYGTSTEETGAVYDRYGFQWNGAAIENLGSANQTSGLIGDVANASASRTAASIDVYSPNLANIYTVCFGSVWDHNNGYTRFPINRIETNTQYTGIQLIASGGATLTGTLRVYGYRNA